MGIPLHRIKDIRLLYGEDPWGSSLISYESFYGILKPKGHVVACRITAENPDEVRIIDHFKKINFVSSYLTIIPLYHCFRNTSCKQFFVVKHLLLFTVSRFPQNI